jgi:protease-4
MRRVFRPFSLLILLHVAVVVITVGILLRQKPEPSLSRMEIAVVPIDGVISLGHGSMGRGASVESIVRQLDEIKDEPQVKAVVLRINSPGGSVGAVQEIYRAVMAVRKKGKYVVSSFGDVAASGGYYVACAGNKIVSNPGTLTGSIGVIMEMPGVQGLLKKVGVTMETIKSGAMKDAGSPYRELNASERAYFSTLVADAYDQFFQAVKAGRPVKEARLREIADGRVFSGRMALNEHLVDNLGGLNDAIELAEKQTGLSDKNPRIVYEKAKSPLEMLLGTMSRSPLEPLGVDLDSNQTKLLYMMR